MQYFTRIGQATLAALGLLSALPALAVGTDAGTPIVNAVTLDYTVNGGAQPQQIDSVSFVVDSALSVDVTSTDAARVSVTIGQVYTGTNGIPALNYTITNTSNGPADIVFALVDQDNQVVSSFAGDGAAADFQPVSVAAAVNTLANQFFDGGAGGDTLLTPDADGIYTLPGGPLAEDASVDVVVAIEVPGVGGAAADEYATYTLVAAVADASGAIAVDNSGNSSPDSGVAPSNDVNDLAAVEIVFRDAAAGDAEDVSFDFFAGGTNPVGPVISADLASNGQNSDTSGFIVAAVGVQVAKYSEVIYDPISGNRYDSLGAPVAPAVEPKAIPGAVVMYVVGVRNRDAAFTANAVAVRDDIADGATAGDTEPVQEGIPPFATVNVPGSVTFDLATGDPATFDTSLVSNFNEVLTVDCADNPTSAAYSATTVVGGNDTAVGVNEVDVSLGSCAQDESGYVVYFVTVEQVN